MIDPFADIKQKGIDERGYVIWETEKERDERLMMEYAFQEQKEIEEGYPLELIEK